MMSNQKKAQAYFTAVNAYDIATVEKMVREDYIQHNPHVPTGRAAFVALFPTLKEHDTKIENIRIFQDSSHVIMHHLWRNAIPFGGKEKAAFHIIRFDPAGLIAEHWSVMRDAAFSNQSGRTLIDGQTTVEDLTETETHKAKTRELFRFLTAPGNKAFADVLPRFFRVDFHQHHPEMRDGIEGFIEAVQNPELALSHRAQHRVFGSGNFVLSISEGFHKNNPTAFYDLFRFKDGLIAEHWSVYQDIPTGQLANNNGMFGFGDEP